MTARTVMVDPFDLVVFGGTGDLARRKLIPALYHRDHAGQMPDDARIVGAARAALDDARYRALAAAALAEHVAPADRDDETIARFLGRLSYARVDAVSDAGWAELAAALGPAEGRVRAFYLAVGPLYFAEIAERLGRCGLARGDARLVIEKPLGRDLQSARALNARIGAVFDEARVYRIDHYLGKEAVQNLMALRFGNALLEPLWNARHVDHVQITVAETVGVAGRGGYYDHAGAMRDMAQNHLMQLLCLTAMEPPARFGPDPVRDEKLKVLRALGPIGAAEAAERVVRGQYAGRGEIASYVADVTGDGAADTGAGGSRTESFVALRVDIENWRWSGAPFYLRTGKRLRARMSEIAVVFKDAPHSIFPVSAGTLKRNTLIIRLQPDEGVTLNMMIKDPGPGGMRLREAPLDMTFAESLGIDGLRMPDAYERLVMDVIRGDQTLFMRGDEVEAAWAWIDPIVAAWEGAGETPLSYDAGGSGPEDALRLMHRDGRRWREIEG